MKPLYIVAILVILSFFIPLSQVYGMPDGEVNHLQGYVYAVDDGVIHPVSFAKVTLYHMDDPVSKMVTNKSGYYSFTLDPGEYTIIVEKIRYITQKAFVILEPDSTLQIDFQYT